MPDIETRDEQNLEKSIGEEVKAQDDYAERGAVAKDPELKKLYKEIAADEAQHEKEFEVALKKNDGKNWPVADCGFAVTQLISQAEDDMREKTLINHWLDLVDNRCGLKLAKTREAIEEYRKLPPETQKLEPYWTSKVINALRQDFEGEDSANHK